MAIVFLVPLSGLIVQPAMGLLRTRLFNLLPNNLQAMPGQQAYWPSEALPDFSCQFTPSPRRAISDVHPRGNLDLPNYFPL